MLSLKENFCLALFLVTCIIIDSNLYLLSWYFGTSKKGVKDYILHPMMYYAVNILLHIICV